MFIFTYKKTMFILKIFKELINHQFSLHNFIINHYYIQETILLIPKSKASTLFLLSSL